MKNKEYIIGVIVVVLIILGFVFLTGDKEETKPQDEGINKETTTTLEVEKNVGESSPEPTEDVQNTSSIETEIDPTADWKSYINKSFGMRFKIPTGWRINENSKAGEYTLQAYDGNVDDKTTEFNILFYTPELDTSNEGNFSSIVNGRKAYMETNKCISNTTCAIEKIIFPLEEGAVVDGMWTGKVAQITVVNYGIVSGALIKTINNMIDTFTLTI